MTETGQIPPTPPLDAEALERYLAGAGAPAERARVETWLDDDPRRRHLVRALRERLDTGVGVAPPADPAGEWQRFRQRHLRDAMPATTPASDGAVRRHGRVSRVSKWQVIRPWGVGVALAVATVVLLRGLRPAVDHPPHSPSRTYVTRAGQRANLVLSDGSRVTLAPRTTLVVPVDFGRVDRVVDLRGEAYFDVIRAADRPFVVRTARVVTRVLGTTFDVRYYTGDPDVRVAVATGKIVVTTPRHTLVTLAAGMLGRFADSSTHVSQINGPDPYTEWSDGHLRFRKTPVADVLATLSRWYGIEFRLEDSAFAAQRVTTTLDYSATTDLVVALERFLDVSATSATTAAGTVITLHPRRPGAQPALGRRDADRSLYSPFTSGVGR